MRPIRHSPIKPDPSSMKVSLWAMIALVLFFVFILSGCSAFTKTETVVKNVPVYVPIICPDPAAIAKLSARPIVPLAIEDKVGIVWVAVSAKHYENMSHNTQESIRVMKDQKGVISYYRECIVRFNSEIDRLKIEADEKREKIHADKEL